jgi:hypothetical protein
MTKEVETKKFKKKKNWNFFLGWLVGSEIVAILDGGFVGFRKILALVID